MISPYPPLDLYKAQTGFYQRQAMFAKALGDIGKLSALFFLPPSLNYSDTAVQDFADRLSQHWNVETRVHFCNRMPYKGHSGFLAKCFEGIWSISHQDDYQCFCSSKQIAEVGDFLQIRKFDFVFAHRLKAMSPLLRIASYLPPVGFDLDDIEHIKFMRYVRHPPYWKSKFLLYSQIPAILLAERKAAKIARFTFVCSDQDQKYLSLIWRFPRIVTIPNCADMPPESPIAENPTLLFLGDLSYAPNRIAADYLVEKIWPLILKLVPSARLTIAGDGKENTKCFHNKPEHVEFAGFVEDLEFLYRKTRVVCCPILSGGGTRVKIIEAAAYGKPIVSTTIGAEGLELRDGREILLRDNPEKFAQACIQLLMNQSLSEQIGASARAAAASKYSKTNAINKIKDTLCKRLG